MDKRQLNILLAKYRQHQLTDKEKQSLIDFIHTEEGEKLLSEVWDDSFEISDIDDDSVDAVSMFQRILLDKRLAKEPITDNVRDIGFFSLKKKRRMVVAACISLAILVGAGLFFLKKESTEGNLLATDENYILPGSDKARIVFDDGSFVELAAVQGDTILRDQGLRIYRKEDGSIAYELNGKKEYRNVYNTIITPKGGEYSLVLPDGSRVWVNAASKLRYPTAFDGEMREVELDGEAYFEVKKAYKNGKRQPFIVRTGEQTLEVLGTSFNINSYDRNITTTLVEGSVALTYPDANSVQYLKPSQQSKFSKTSKKVSIATVDPYYTVAWKHGKFAFEGASIYTVMEDVARWYDVDVQYEGDLSDVRYTGTISRFENFKQLLQLIEWTNLVTFKVDGRRVTVMK